MNFKVSSQTTNVEPLPIIQMPDDPWKTDLVHLLIKLGQKLIETDWRGQKLTMSQVSNLCRNYRLKWKHRTTWKTLQGHATEYFKTSAEIRVPGVSVQYLTEADESGRAGRPFLIFRKLNPDGSCS